MRRNTRQDIVDAFILAVEQSSLSKLRIADLIAELGINRNTFYYHFSSKYDVALLVLCADLDSELRSALPERNLIYCKFSENELNKFPLAYYTHVETGARTLDSSVFMRSFVHCTLKRPLFYRKLFSDDELDFRQHLDTLYKPAVERDIEFILDGRYMPPVTKRMLTQMATRYISSVTRFCLKDCEGDLMLDDRVNPFWNIIHESLYNAIQTHPINRYVSHSNGSIAKENEKTPPPRAGRDLFDGACRLGIA